MAAAVDCAKILRAIDAIVKDADFVAEARRLVDAHCDTFTDDVENKLEYSTIHNEYIAFVEDYIGKRLSESLGPSFDMGAFMDALPAFVETSNKGGSADEASTETMDFLLTFGDMESFKDMMLVAKKDKKTSSGALEGTGKLAFSADHQKVIDEAKAICSELISVAEGDAGWKVVTDKPWIKLERKTASDGSSEFLRTTTVLDISVSAGEDLMLNFTKEMGQWNSMMTDAETIHEYNGKDDRAIRFLMRMPMVPPKVVNSRLIVTRDCPSAGAVTYMYLDIDPETKELLPAKHSLGAGCIFPVEGEPNKCRYRAVDQVTNGWIPKFIMNWMVTGWFPRQLTSQVIKYKKVKGIKD